MVKYVLLFILLHALPAHGQNFAINNEKQNTLTVCENNPITIAVNNCPCKNIKVIALFAEAVKLTNQPCRYNIIPDKTGRTVITLIEETKGKIIGSLEYRVKSPEICLAFAGKCGGGKVEKEVIIGEPEFEVVTSTGADYDPGYRLQEFTISILRKGDVIFNEETNGYLLAPKTKKYFEKLRSGDIIKFDPILK
ncbi:MAG: hypothetical protein EOO89_12485 [Pedobacter sp.]|nr:MAG: hypothetical protein EOO89_12485 [Pedobacter sp.]